MFLKTTDKIIKYYFLSRMFLGSTSVSCSFTRNNQFNHRVYTKILEGKKEPIEPKSIMDNNQSARDLTLDAIKSVVSQALLGKFTAVFPKLFKCQWKTYEGQKKVS